MSFIAIDAPITNTEQISMTTEDGMSMIIVITNSENAHIRTAPHTQAVTPLLTILIKNEDETPALIQNEDTNEKRRANGIEDIEKARTVRRSIDGIRTNVIGVGNGISEVLVPLFRVPLSIGRRGIKEQSMSTIILKDDMKTLTSTLNRDITINTKEEIIRGIM